MHIPQNAVAVVTGAGSGIGASLARDLDRRGLRLALCDVDFPSLRAVAAELRGEPLIEAVDVSDSEAVMRFARRVLRELGTPVLVIANAGVAISGDVLRGDIEDWRWLDGINYWGVVYTVRAFLPSMVAAGTGWIATVSSIFGIIGVPNYAAYCASKGAVRGFTEALDQELRATGVGVSCVHPGGVATNIVLNGRIGQGLHGLTRARAAETIARGMSPERAAAALLRGVEREHRRILIGADANVIDLAQRLFPVGYRTAASWLQRVF